MDRELVSEKTTEDLEVDQLLDGLFQRYGHDFRGYSRESIKRRIRVALTRSSCATIPEMLERALRDSTYCHDLISDLTVNVTEMFRDPEVYLSLRRVVLPMLRTYPSIKIWHAGCATGEEVYSMAILLKEEGLYDRAHLYGTDISDRALARARAGIYAADQVKQSTLNYQKAGGIEPFTNYYGLKSGTIAIAEDLRRNVSFANHNLVTDDVFSEFQLILCRNVLIYFDRELQNRTLELFNRSLSRRGFLCLGTKETVEFSGMGAVFEAVDKKHRIYRRR